MTITPLRRRLPAYSVFGRCTFLSAPKMDGDVVPNRLYYGDNREVLRELFKAECIDLIYLDPPFNSAVAYNVLFKPAQARLADASTEAFEDNWTWGDASWQALHDIRAGDNRQLHALVQALQVTVGETGMLAYLVMMAVRLVEFHRVLKPTGSLYLHCDPTASHYLKLILDAVFGRENFRNEIVWKRAATVKGNAAQGSTQFGPNTDSILFYAKSPAAPFHQPLRAYSETNLERSYKFVEPETGRRY